MVVWGEQKRALGTFLDCRKYAVIVPTNAHKYTKISLYTQWTPTCFGEPCGHLQGCKLQRLLFFTPMDWF